MRKLKADKASKDEITAAVQILLALKGEYKQATGRDWDPNAKPEPAVPTGGALTAAWEKVQTQGDKVGENSAAVL